MRLVPFDTLPKEFKNDEVKLYYDILKNKKASLFAKRVLDLIVGAILLVILLLPMVVIAIVVKCTSEGPIFYKQQRVTSYGKTFNILKFRTMFVGADKSGPLVTCDGDNRITSIGRKLRKFRLDELPQIFHVLSGKMSIVGTRPEVPKYVQCYTPSMYATLLMPAGITSLASITFKDEDEMLKNSQNADEEYVNKILPLKMKYNLEYISKFGFRNDIKLMFKTVKDVLL